MRLFTKLKGPIILLITALIWGTTFVAQSLGSDYIGPFTYNALRFTITGIILSIYCLVRYKLDKKTNKQRVLINKLDKTNKWVYMMAFFIGVALFCGANLQQAGITITKSPSKSAFISTIYMVFVPLIGLMFKKKVRFIIWPCLLVALTGSFFISITGEFEPQLGDIITLICALAFGFQISLIDIINPHIDSILLSAIEFMIAGGMSLIVMFISEDIILSNIYKSMPAVLYGALLSGCIAYTFQIIGQKYTEPSIASMIMSLESVFALLSGIVVLNETLSRREWLGCALIFIAIIVAQIDFKSLFKRSFKWPKEKEKTDISLLK